MTKEEIKQIKLPDMSYLKSIGKMLNRTNVGAIATPKLKELVDPKNEMIAHIEENTSEMKENGKNQFGKNLLIAVIGGIIGGAVPYLLALILG